MKVPNDSFTKVHHKDYEKGRHISALADRFLFDGAEEYGGTIVLLSLLGPHSAVKAILAAVATGLSIQADRYPRASFRGTAGGRLLTAPLGRGTVHGCYVGPQLLDPEENHFALLGDDPGKIFARLCRRVALAALPEWSGWIVQVLKSKRALEPLRGIGENGCLIRASETTLDEIVSKGVNSGALAF